MSWTKRPQGGTVPPPGPERQGYAVPLAKPFGNQENMYPNYQGGAAGNMPQQQQYWQMPPQQSQFNQQYGQVYQQQDYPANANQFYPQSTYNNMNVATQGYNNTQQQQARYPQQNYYQSQPLENQGHQQNMTQTKPNADGWEDNWDWGWGDDASKHAQKVSQNIMQQQMPPPQQQPFNNANVIEESFAATDANCWNWAINDKKDNKDSVAAPAVHEQSTLPVPNPVENNTVPEQSALRTASNMSAQQSEEVRTLNDREVVKERLPNLALGKRFHLDNLTPQWSIESQMSQESSDGLHTQSEGTYRSENQSRNSSKSSPGPNTDNSNFNYSQPGLEDGFGLNSEWSTRPSDEVTLAESTQNNSRRESHDELSSSLQEMSLANHENPVTGSLHHGQEAPRNVQEPPVGAQPPPAISPASFPPPVSSSLPPPPTAAMPPAPPVSAIPPAASPSLAQLSAPPSSSAIPPPNFPPPTSSSNPFKHPGPFSHKPIVKGSASSPSVQAFPPQIPSTNLTSPAVVNKVSQHNRVSVGFEANLETTPDNSERPDQPQMSAFRPVPVSPQVPDNLEVAPRNDRNEYLQTAHLSSGDFGENTDFSRTVPPPGLRRMVVGQQESEYSQNLNISGDEPPPGLARMVPGQQTEVDNSYNQAGDNYLDRHIDGQTTDGSRPYRQADGQQTPDNYTQAPASRVTERRPIGLDRMVPGEPSNDEYSQYPAANYASSNEQRVVTGVDHDFAIPADAGPSDIREQNVDGSDYTEQSSRNPPRNVIRPREATNEVSTDFAPPPEEQQREVIMEGENLQDLSIISSTELTFSREQVLDGADLTQTDVGAKTDLSDSIDNQASSSRRQSLNRVNTSGDDSERDRAFKSSPRRDRDKHKASRDRERDRDRDRERDRDRDRDKDGRYSRGDRKYDPDRRSTREERRSEKERRDRDGYRDRRDRDESPDTRRHRRSTRSHRYETEDTDYYSDKERDRRRHREGSYTSSKPPRPEDKDRRYDERDRSKRYNTIERERRYDDERERRRSDRHRDRDRYERAYRDIDPTRKYGNLRRQRDKDDPRRGEFSSPSRPDSREATVTDDDGTESRRRERRSRRTAEPFYDEYGSGSGYTDPYLAQRQQYQYYEQLRLTNPAAYMALYKQLMAGHAPPPPPHDYRAPHQSAPLYVDDFGSIPYDGRQERGSVHSGRSSTTGLKGNDTYVTYGAYRHDAAGSLRDAPSLRTDLSDRDLNTDMSLNLHLEESTVRSERMTPFRYSTAHIKGSISSRDVVVVRPSYPVDGVPATVHVLSLAAALAHHPSTAELTAFPGPLVKGVTHKKSVIDYCGARVRGAGREGARDVTGYVLLWELLALMLRQNGVVVGSDIAELLMKNTREYEYRITTNNNKTHSESRRGSSMSCELREGCDEEGASSPEQPSLSVSENINQESVSSPGQSASDERAALDKLRELLIYGNRQEALECAMSGGLWGHALALAAHGERRARAAVTARFVAALPRADPLHTLYATLAATPPPAVTCVADEKWGDWRPHAAMILSNPSTKPEQDRRTLTQLGDSLLSRGLVYSAQFCYVSGGVPLCRHPLAPLAPADGAAGAGSAAPRLALLLADSRVHCLHHLATNLAIFATEVYEYAQSLSQEDFVITELQVYKLLLASRLVDAGQYERALAYTEAAARAVTRSPQHYSPKLITTLAELADRLKYHDPALQDDPPLVEEADSAEPSPRHHQQWLDDVKNVAHMLSAGGAAPGTPQHDYYAPQAQQQQQYGWGEQQAPQYQQVQPVPTYPEPVAEDKADYAPQYYAPTQQLTPQHQPQQQQQPIEDQQYTQYEDWPKQEEQHQQYADPYWHGDQNYGGYGEGVAGGAAGGGAEDARPSITMPGSNKPRAPAYDYDDDRPPSADQNDRDTDTPKTATKKQESRSKEDSNKNESKSNKSGGWLGGILNKLSLRAPNQMILPDDKNPSIVWDAETKRWRNLDSDGDETDQPPPPPPKTTDLPHLMQNTSSPLPAAGSAGPTAGAPPPAMAAPPVSNIFKMQKGRHIKKSYVDVFNPSGAPTRALPPAADVLGPTAPLAPPTNYFVPAPAQEPVLDDLPDAIEVSMPPSRAITPPKKYEKGSMYDPTTMEGQDDMLNYHSGI